MMKPGSVINKWYHSEHPHRITICLASWRLPIPHTTITPSRTKSLVVAIWTPQALGCFRRHCTGGARGAPMSIEIQTKWIGICNDLQSCADYLSNISREMINDDKRFRWMIGLYWILLGYINWLNSACKITTALPHGLPTVP